VTQLAVACGLLEIPVDPVALFYSEDDLMLLWLGCVVERVSQENRRQAAEAKRRGKGKHAG
jgi:hypothetical protein